MKINFLILKTYSLYTLFQLSAFILTLLSFKQTVFGQGQGGNDGGGQGSNDGADPSHDPSAGDLNYQLENPIGVDTIDGFIKAILDIVLTIGIPIVALAIIYAGFLFVTARGNQEKLTDAKKTLGYTLLGGAILLGSWLLAQALGETIKQLE